MVKADGYGLGARKIAKYVEDVVDGFGVETLEEGVELRKAGISKDILVLALEKNEISTAYRYALTVGLHNFVQLSEIESLIGQNCICADKLRVQIKVDSGMHRLGFEPSDLQDVLKRARRLGLCVEGVYSHLRDETETQKPCFDSAVSVVREFYPQAKAHLASSHSLGNADLRYDAVRLGIGAYEGAVKMLSQVIESRHVKAGEAVSYGNEIMQADCNVAVVFGGYADSVARENPSSVRINGRKCRVVGNVCMDCFVVETGEYVAKIGEKVLIFDKNTASEVAKERRTIEYTLTTGIKGRVKRKYLT